MNPIHKTMFIPILNRHSLLIWLLCLSPIGVKGLKCSHLITLLNKHCTAYLFGSATTEAVVSVIDQ